VLDPDRSDAISGSSGRGAIVPRPTGCSSAVVTHSTPSGLSTGRSPGESRGAFHFPVISGEQHKPRSSPDQNSPAPRPPITGTGSLVKKTGPADSLVKKPRRFLNKPGRTRAHAPAHTHARVGSSPEHRTLRWASGPTGSAFAATLAHTGADRQCTQRNRRTSCSRCFARSGA
jgi:hypothetical protein